MAGLLSLGTVFPTAGYAATSVSSKTSIHKYIENAKKLYDQKYPNAGQETTNKPNGKPRKSQIKEGKSSVVNKSKANNKSTLSPKLKGKLSHSSKLKKEKFVPNELIIKFKAGVNSDTLKKKYSLETKKKLKFKGAEVVKIKNGQKVESLVNILSKDPSVELVQPNFKYYPASNDPLYKELWGLDNQGQEVQGIPGVKDIDIDAPEAWEKLNNPKEVVVAVIDTGVDINHPDLQGKIWVNAKEIPNNQKDDDGNGYVDDVNGWDFYNKDNTVFDPEDGDEHGTHVAGTIAAVPNNGVGVAGVAPNVKIMPLKFLGPYGGTTEDAIDAIEYAKAMGVKISNNSWGGGGYDPLLKAAIEQSNSLFIAAAGNDGMDNDEIPHYPSSYESKNIVSVAALDNLGYLAPFSNYGVNSVDVAAPGVSILSTVPKKLEAGAAAEIEGPNYKAVFNGFGFENIKDQAQRQDAFNRALQYLGATDQSKILLVQDDESDYTDPYGNKFPNFLPFYEEMLTNYNVTVKTVQAGEDGPDFNTLQDYDIVIWFTGRGLGIASPESTLTEADLTALTNYLNSNGKLILSGQDALWLNEQSDFAVNVLGLTIVGEGKARDVAGKPNTIYDAKTYSIDAEGAPYADYLASDETNSGTLGKATVDLVYPAEKDYAKAYDYLDGTSMATPHVTGTAALLLGQNPNLRPEEMATMLKLRGKSLSSLEGWISSGKLVSATEVLHANDNDVPGVPLSDYFTVGDLDAQTDTDDVFAIYLEQGEQLNAQLDGKPGTDFDLYLYKPDTITVGNSAGMLSYSENPNTSVENIKFVAPESGIYYIDVYAYAGAGSYTLAVGNTDGEYENTSNALRFNGVWQLVSNPLFSNGSLHTINSQGYVEFSFVGNEFEWVGLKDANQGIAKIYVDGVPREVSLYSPTTLPKTTIFKQTFDQLGKHTIRIEWTGKNDPKNKKSRTSINVDKLVVRYRIVAPDNVTAHFNIDERAPMVSWNASQGAIGYNVYRKESAQKNYTLLNSAPIYGTQFVDKTAVAGKTYDYAVVAISLRNSDLSKPFTYVYDDDVPGIAITNNKATGTLSIEQFDFFDVWSAQMDQGKMYQIKLEGAAGTDFDLLLFNKDATSIYSSEPLKGSGSTGTSSETIVFQPNASGKYYIVPVAFSGSGSYTISVSTLTIKKVEESDASIKYAPTTPTNSWTTVSAMAASGGKYKVSANTNATVSYTFTGKGIRWYGVQDNKGGVVEVYIDNQLVGEVDLYSQASQYNKLLFERLNLPSGTHTITLKNTGQKNTNSTGTNISVDAFEVIQ